MTKVHHSFKDDIHVFKHIFKIDGFRLFGDETVHTLHVPQSLGLWKMSGPLPGSHENSHSSSDETSRFDQCVPVPRKNPWYKKQLFTEVEVNSSLYLPCRENCFSICLAKLFSHILFLKFFTVLRDSL